MEVALNVFLKKLSERLDHHFISKGLSEEIEAAKRPIKTMFEEGNKKLLLHDKFGTAYNIDSVIANQSLQPIILIESKYIRYKKDNRDKGSWLCTAHPAIRRRYASIRSSIAVLAGNWSMTSRAMIQSYDINIFLVPFKTICELLAHHSIDFNWGEKDRITAQKSWKKYLSLTARQRAAIGEEMVNLIKKDLETLVVKILDDSTPRDIKRVSIELHSNLGEVRIYEFPSIVEAIEFLNTAELKTVFITTDSLTLLDLPREL
jgi:hypothetical protein